MGAMPVPVAIKDGVGDGLFKNKVAVGAVNLDRAADGQIWQVGEMIGEEALPRRG